MKDELEVALRLAREAGDAILHVYARDFAVERKADAEPVTEADRTADHLIRIGLLEAFPDDGLLSEESPDDFERLEKRRLWIVDPLDGTRQFVKHIPEFAVMIGLAVEGRAVLGVVHLPCEKESYVAWERGGCFRVDASGEFQRVHVDERPLDPARMRVTVSRTLERTRTERVLISLGDVPVVRSGSVGRKAALIARGDADAYFTLSGRSNHWDACAPEVIVREAGGFFGDARGRTLVYNTAETRNERGLLGCRHELTATLVDALARGTALD